MTPEDKFRLVAGLALVDGQLGSDEQPVVLRAAGQLGIPQDQATAIVQNLMQGGKVGSTTPPSSASERRELFQLLVDVAAADGQVTPQEMGVLQHMAGAFSLRPGDVPSMLQAALAKRGAPPVPGTTAPIAGAPESIRKKAQAGEAGCPSCGAPIEFKNTRSVALMCEYCDTTVTRGDGSEALRDLGKISALVADASPIQIGARGEAFGSGFEVLGRLQLEHKTGYWNEWFLQWDDGKVGWLGEAQGQYYVTLPMGEVEAPQNLPSFNQIAVGQRIFLGKKRYTVTDVRMARATGGEGELPFIVGNGYELPYADLRRSDSGFASIDFSEDPPLVFTGKAVGWRDLNMTNYRVFDGWAN
ncbi:MAG TPA: hypothetical protein DEA08_29935 [Planctomycetes bacterium]|nr:hypothetical protein [Planctomycetota bacterium]